MTNDVATGNILDFLNRSELDFGSSPEDVEILSDAAALRDRVAHLLVQPPIWVSTEYAGLLRSSVSEADWRTIAAEQNQRILAADTLQAGSMEQGSSVLKSSA